MKTKFESHKIANTSDDGLIFAECNLMEIQIMNEIMSSMITLKVNNELLNDSILCFMSFTRYGIPPSMTIADVKFNILPSILKFLSFPKTTEMYDIHCSFIKCIINMISKGPNRKSYCDLLIRSGNILNNLYQFIDLCWNSEGLYLVSSIYQWLCNSVKILKKPSVQPGGVITDSCKVENWNVLKPLNTFLFYEDNQSVIVNALKGYIVLMDETAHSHQDIDNIISENRNHQLIINKCMTKLKQNKLLFHGFIHHKYIPNDINCIIFQYYNCYLINNNTDILSRLMALIDKENMYGVEVRKKAISCLTKITQFCNGNVSVKLTNKYGVLDRLNIILNDDCPMQVFMDWNDIYWILSNIAYDNFMTVWNSNVIQSMIKKFMNETFNVQGTMIWPLSDLIERIGDENKINEIVICGDIIQAIVRFLNCVLMYDGNIESLSFDVNAIIGKLLDLITHLVTNQCNRQIVVKKMNQFDGVYVLNKLKQNKMKLSMNQQQQIRLSRVLSQYLDTNNGIDEKIDDI